MRTKLLHLLIGSLLASCGGGDDAETSAPTTMAPADLLVAAVEACQNDTDAAVVAFDVVADSTSGAEDYPEFIAEQREELLQGWADVFEIDSDGSITLEGIGASPDTDAGESMWYGTTMAAAWDCLSAKLDVPARIESQIANTRALDGMQTAEWSGFEGQWNFHPDSGMAITIWVPTE